MSIHGFLLLILVGWFRARYAFYGVSLVYLAWTLGETAFTVANEQFGFFSLPRFTHYYYPAKIVLGLAFFFSFAKLGRNEIARQPPASMKALLVALCISMFVLDTRDAWHRLYARFFDPSWIQVVERKLPNILASDDFRLLTYTALYALALWFTLRMSGSHGGPLVRRT